MGVLLPVGVILITLGLAGTATSCYQSGVFDKKENAATSVAPAEEPTPTESASTRSPIILAPLSGLSLAIGLACVGIGAGHWRHPIPSNVRPANPWSDQPYEHGDPPKGLV
jgi:hypothetical protein